jgi:hypothetical protein
MGYGYMVACGNRDSTSGLHIVPICNFPLNRKCVPPHYSSDHSGISLHFCLMGSENENTLISLCNYIVDVLQSVYPFERHFLSSFSSRLLDEVKKHPFYVKGPRTMVVILIEWISFATLIVSFRNTTSAYINVKINSIECLIPCILQ